jgi:hypothetical protein
MLDAATYVHGGGLGFEGMSFYFAGRAGVLGDVDADAVTDALAFFNPQLISGVWGPAGDVLPREKAAAEFAACAYKWGEEHLPDDVDAATLAALAKRVVDAAAPPNAPIFERWRQLPAPPEPKAAAMHYMNALRELRFALHADAVRAQGIDVSEAHRYRSPHMAALFGWPEPFEASDEFKAQWHQADEATDTAMAEALGVLLADELDTFVAVANAAAAATA